MTRKALVIGYGNTLRGDDAVGQAAAQALAGEAATEGAEVIACHQLTPELAERIAAADRVVFIDAAADLQPGAIVVATVPAAPLASGVAHHIDPRALLFLTTRLYGRTPDAFLVRVGAGSFELREGLSAAVASALPEVVATVRRLVLERPGTQVRTESNMVPSASSS
ncbi:MAG: hydrogenase maturation protease [Acetobacteraceae bacterium]